MTRTVRESFDHIGYQTTRTAAGDPTATVSFTTIGVTQQKESN